MSEALVELIYRYKKITEFIDGTGVEWPLPDHKQHAGDMQLLAQRILRLECRLEQTQRLLNERTLA